jgi:hypothetical protein
VIFIIKQFFMKKVVRLTESDLVRLVKKVISEQGQVPNFSSFGGVFPKFLEIVNGAGTSDQRVKNFCNVCKSIKAPVTQTSNRLSDMIRDAVQGAGTVEQNIFRAFQSIKTVEDFCGLVTSYEQSYGVPLYDDLDDDIDQESEWVQIFRPIRDAILRSKEMGQKRTSITKQTTGVGQPSQTGASQRPTTGKPASGTTTAQQRPAGVQTGQQFVTAQNQRMNQARQSGTVR